MAEIDLEAEVPPALAAWLHEHFPDPQLARRALLIPRVAMHFGCLWDNRQLWVDPTHNTPQEEARRQYLTTDLLNPDEQFGLTSVAQPFLFSSGTGGTVRSPFRQLTDAQYYGFVALWRSETEAQKWLQKPLTKLGTNSLEYLDTERKRIAERQDSFVAKLHDHIFGTGKKRDPLMEVWDAHMFEIYPVYL